MTPTDADRERPRARLIAVQAMLEELRDNPSAFSPAALSGVAIRALEALAATRVEALEQHYQDAIRCTQIVIHRQRITEGSYAVAANAARAVATELTKWKEQRIRALIATPAETEKK